MQDAKARASYFMEAIYHGLVAVQPSVGRRLKPERELASEFGLSRSKVNRSIQGLVDQEILVRQHGSGVYVRKIPSELIAFTATEYPEVFAEEKGATRINPPTSKLRLRLELWWRKSPPGETTNSVHRGIIDQIEELGHEVRLNRVEPEETEEGLRKRLAKMARNTPCDGRIVLAQFAPSFESVIEVDRIPTVYIWTANAGHTLQPLVQIDQSEAVIRALKILAGEGYHRIALLGLDNRADVAKGPIGSLESYLRPVYEQTLWSLGQSFRFMEFCGAHEAAVGQAMKGILEAKADALVVADDIVFRHAVQAAERMGTPLGTKLPVIVLSNRGNALPAGTDWSRLESDPYSTGRLAVTSLVRDIESVGSELLSFSHNATWWPGVTHRPAVMVGERKTLRSRIRLVGNKT